MTALLEYLRLERYKNCAPMHLIGAKVNYPAAMFNIILWSFCIFLFHLIVICVKFGAAAYLKIDVGDDGESCSSISTIQ